jgi:uncharacterized protein (TIGR02598 family)
MNRLRPTAGFSLVEIALAVGVMAFCLVAVLGLLPIGQSSDQAAIEQTTAAGIAASLAADLRQTPLAAANSTADPQSPRFLVSVPQISGDTLTHTLFFTVDGTVAATNGTTVSAQDQNANPSLSPRYRATMVFTLPAHPNQDRTATVVRILLTWPAMASPTGGSLPTQFTGSFETIIALDRN